MTDREAMAKAIMGYDLAELSTVYPGDEHNWSNALKAADRVIALQTIDGHWEYDEVIFGDEDEAPVVEAKRWVGRWSPLAEHERGSSEHGD